MGVWGNLEVPSRSYDLVLTGPNIPTSLGSDGALEAQTGSKPAWY